MRMNINKDKQLARIWRSLGVSLKEAKAWEKLFKHTNLTGSFEIKREMIFAKDVHPLLRSSVEITFKKPDKWGNYSRAEKECNIVQFELAKKKPKGVLSITPHYNDKKLDK